MVHTKTSGRNVSLHAHRGAHPFTVADHSWCFRIRQDLKHQRHEAHAALSGASAEVAELQAQLAEMRRREQAAQVGRCLR